MPSSATSNAIVMKSAGWITQMQYSDAKGRVDTTRIKPYIWISARLGYGSGSGPVFHQYGGAPARDASPDAAQIRASRSGAADPHVGQHAAVLPRGTGAAQVDQAARGRRGDQ